MTKNRVLKNLRKLKKITLWERAGLVNVYKRKEFTDFVAWLSLPPLLKGRSKDYLTKMGITDECAVRLFEIKNMTAFAKKYDIEPGTLTDWKRKAEESGLLDTSKNFYRELTNNVFCSFYLETLKNADAARVRLWLEVFAGKAPEIPPVINQNILTPQFNQVIGQLRVEYNEKLRKHYEDKVRESAAKAGEKVPSPKLTSIDKKQEKTRKRGFAEM